MVSAWALGLFLAGLALVAIELAYPRRYLGVVGVVASVAGLVGMVGPDESSPTIIALVALTAVLTAAIAIPFYRRYAPHVGPLIVPDVGAGSIGVVEQAITPQKDGLVRAGGILWTAQADRPIAAGAHARILVVEADRLWVEEELPAAPDEDHQEDDAQRGTPR